MGVISADQHIRRLEHHSCSQISNGPCIFNLLFLYIEHIPKLIKSRNANNTVLVMSHVVILLGKLYLFYVHWCPLLLNK